MKLIWYCQCWCIFSINLVKVREVWLGIKQKHLTFWDRGSIMKALPWYCKEACHFLVYTLAAGACHCFCSLSRLKFRKCYGHLADLILIYVIMEKSQYVEADLFFLFRSFTKHSLRSGTRHLSFPKQENPWFCMSRTITRSFQPLVLAIAPWNTACFLWISLPINGYRSKG